MSGDDPQSPGWADRVRHWLWLDRTQRTDDREANRGFYPGGPPVYLDRKPVGWRFVVPVVIAGIVIAIILTLVRDTPAGSTDQQALGFDAPRPSIAQGIDP